MSRWLLGEGEKLLKWGRKLINWGATPAQHACNLKILIIYTFYDLLVWYHTEYYSRTLSSTLAPGPGRVSSGTFTNYYTVGNLSVSAFYDVWHTVLLQSCGKEHLQSTYYPTVTRLCILYRQYYL